MLATCKDLVHPKKALKSAQRPKLTHGHSLVVTWGNHWSLQLFLEGDGFQRQPVDWLLPSRPSSPQQTLQVGRGWWRHQDGLTIWRKPGNPGALPVPVEPGGMGPWGEGRRADNPPHTSLQRPPKPLLPLGKLWRSIAEAAGSSHSPIVGAAQATGGMAACNKRPVWNCSQILPISQILLLCLLVSGRELCDPPKGMEWPASHLWCAESQVGDAGTPKQPELPRSVFQTGQDQNLSLPFHCSTPGRATDWSCKQPVLKFYITKTTRAKWIPSIRVPSPWRPLLGK